MEQRLEALCDGLGRIGRPRGARARGSGLKHMSCFLQCDAGVGCSERRRHGGSAEQQQHRPRTRGGGGLQARLRVLARCRLSDRGPQAKRVPSKKSKSCCSVQVGGG